MTSLTRIKRQKAKKISVAFGEIFLRALLRTCIELGI